MAHIQFTDEAVKEYLIFRGFSSSLKAFDNELKSEKDKGFRIDKIIDNLNHCIHNYDLNGLKEAWGHIETKLITKVEQQLAVATKKLEIALYKLYLAHAVENNKTEKVNEFFAKLAAENQQDWRDWFALPHCKYPEENATFAVYFTKQWQDTFFVSLHNFLASAYQNLPMPALSECEASSKKMAALQKENEVLRRGLANLLNEPGADGEPPDDLSDVMDDFYNIANQVKIAESQAKTLKAFKKLGSSSSKVSSSVPLTVRKPSSPRFQEPKRSISSERRNVVVRERDPSIGRVSDSPGSFLFLSQDEYKEHGCGIQSLRLNGRGNMVCSLDVQGTIRVWSTSPLCRTIAVFSSRPNTHIIEWVTHHERYLLAADTSNHLRLLDVREGHEMWEISFSETIRLDAIVSNPTESSALLLMGGKLEYLDLKTRKIEKCLEIPGVVSSYAFTPNGQHVVCGCQEGGLYVVDIKKNEITATFTGAASGIHHIQLTNSGATCFYVTARRKFCRVALQDNSRSLALNFPEDCHIPERNRPFLVDSSGVFLLAQTTSTGVIFKICDEFKKCLELGGHKREVTSVDWCFANQCATCVTASCDGVITISTLLIDAT